MRRDVIAWSAYFGVALLCIVLMLAYSLDTLAHPLSDESTVTLQPTPGLTPTPSATPTPLRHFLPLLHRSGPTPKPTPHLTP